jgi:hypothetical protein
MSPERWQEVEALYHAALEQKPEGRGAFVREASGDDTELLSEVESLLAQASSPGLLNRPAWEAAGELLETRTMLGPGAQLGAYRIEGLLGAGGMGEVYRARDTRLGRDVALKVLRRESAGDSERQRRFEHEARAAAALNHPNIVAVYDVGESDGIRFIVSELVAGESLLALLKRGPLAPARAVEIAAQIAEGLSAAHAAGIVHRDLKPGNIMIVPADLGQPGRVKILDFGLAEHVIRGPDDATCTALTRAGVVVGTVAYMSPEQARGVAVDARSDLWSLGVVLYEMLTGRLPFAGAGTVDILAGIIEREPAVFAGPRELQRIVFKALAKDRERRYASARDLLADLRALRPGSAVSRRAVVGVAAAAVIAAGGAILWRGFDPPVALTWSLIAQKMQAGQPAGEPYAAGTADVFEAGWRFRVQLQSPKASVAYVLDEGPSPESGGALSMLGRIELQPAQAAETGWLVFDANPGVERLWIVRASHLVSQMEEAARTALTPENQGRLDAARAGAIRDLLANCKITSETSSDGGMSLRGRRDILCAELYLRHQ